MGVSFQNCWERERETEREQHDRRGSVPLSFLSLLSLCFLCALCPVGRSCMSQGSLMMCPFARKLVGMNLWHGQLLELAVLCDVAFRTGNF